MNKHFTSYEILAKWFPNEMGSKEFIGVKRVRRALGKCKDSSQQCQCENLPMEVIIDFNTCVKEDVGGYWQFPQWYHKTFLKQCFVPYMEDEREINDILDLMIHKIEEQSQIIMQLNQDLKNVKNEVHYMPGNDGYLAAEKEFRSLQSPNAI